MEFLVLALAAGVVAGPHPSPTSCTTTTTPEFPVLGTKIFGGTFTNTPSPYPFWEYPPPSPKMHLPDDNDWPWLDVEVTTTPPMPQEGEPYGWVVRRAPKKIQLFGYGDPTGVSKAEETKSG